MTSSFHFLLALPEIVILAMGCFAVLASVFTRSPTIVYGIVQLALLVAAVLTFQQMNLPTSVGFQGSFVVDPLAVLIKLFVYAIVFFSLLYAKRYVKETGILVKEFYLLALFSVLGMMVLVSAYDFLTLFLGLELFSLPVYAMVALRRDSALCAEAAIKYFVMGAVATGMLLYGLSMLYGATGSIQLPTVAASITATMESHRLILVFGLVFTLAGMAFKLGAVPFHMWVPDVYEGAPTAVTLFISTAPKLVGFALLYRLLVDAMPGLALDWQQILIVVAIASMALGNVVAIVQNNLKRLLAYSSIAHMGYMLLGILTATPKGYGASLFYMFTYAIMSLAAFGLLVILSRGGRELVHINDLKGLNVKNPWLAFLMLMTMFSLAGLPPLVGFMAKLGVLEALIDAHLIWLAAIALVFAVMGVYYYIRIIKVIYFDAPSSELAGVPLCIDHDERVAISLNVILLVALGIFPGVLFQLSHSVF